MSTDPAFLFFPNDYLGGTMGFSCEQHGAYLLLLIYQFNNGPFSPEKAATIVGALLFESIRHKFVEKDGCICNARLMQEIEKRKEFSDSRRENAQKGWKNRKNNKKNMQVHSICNDSAMHMGNGNGNRNEDRIEDENIGKKVQKENPIVEDILKYLNEKLGTHFRSDTAGFISGRLREGYTFDDFKKVVDKKYIQWAGDEKMIKFLRPKTLFSPEHFGEYLNEIDHIDPKTEDIRTDKMLRERGLIK
jgi:uncharacterized phage protein (TIGR02220 family)